MTQNRTENACRYHWPSFEHLFCKRQLIRAPRRPIAQLAQMRILPPQSACPLVLGRVIFALRPPLVDMLLGFVGFGRSRSRFSRLQFMTARLTVAGDALGAAAIQAIAGAADGAALLAPFRYAGTQSLAESSARSR